MYRYKKACVMGILMLAQPRAEYLHVYTSINAKCLPTVDNKASITQTVLVACMTGDRDRYLRTLLSLYHIINSNHLPGAPHICINESGQHWFS